MLVFVIDLTYSLDNRCGGIQVMHLTNTTCTS